MIRSKHMLLAGLILIMIAIVWTPALWSITELSGHHWWLVRLPLVISMPLGLILFLYSIENNGTDLKKSVKAIDAGDFDLANEILTRAIESNPGEAALYRSKAIALMFAGRDAEANAAIEKALQLNTDDQLTQRVSCMIKAVAAGQQKRPQSIEEV